MCMILETRIAELIKLKKKKNKCGVQIEEEI